MAKVHLTDRKLQALKTERNQEDFWDANLPGFGVRVSRQGRKSFVVMYYARGKKRRLTLGSYPALSLAEARVQAKSALYDAAQGNDPQQAKQEEKQAVTFDQLAEEYMERHAKVKKRSWHRDEQKLRADLLPAWSGWKAKEINRREVTAVLDRIVARGAPMHANNVRALISTMFNFGISRGLVEVNPCHGLPRPAKPRQRDRVLSTAEIRAFWRALDEDDSVSGESLRFRLLTAQRGIEVQKMRWDQIDGDWWTIPAAVTKNGLAHRVPLSAECLAVLARLEPVTGETDWVFASTKRKNRPLSVVQDAKERVIERTGIDFKAHDLRRTAASHMTSMGISRLVVSKILNHAESGVTAVYDRHSYDPEKREALALWGARLMELVKGDSAASPASPLVEATVSERTRAEA